MLILCDPIGRPYWKALSLSHATSLTSLYLSDIQNFGDEGSERHDFPALQQVLTSVLPRVPSITALTINLYYVIDEDYDREVASDAPVHLVLTHIVDWDTLRALFKRLRAAGLNSLRFELSVVSVQLADLMLGDSASSTRTSNEAFLKERLAEWEDLYAYKVRLLLLLSTGDQTQESSCSFRLHVHIGVIRQASTSVLCLGMTEVYIHPTYPTSSSKPMS